MGDLRELFCAVFYLKLFYTGHLLAVVVVIAGLQFLPFTAQFGDAVAVDIVAVVGITTKSEAIAFDLSGAGLLLGFVFRIGGSQDIVRGVMHKVFGVGAVYLGKAVEGVVVVATGAPQAVLNLGDLASFVVLVAALQDGV